MSRFKRFAHSLASGYFLLGVNALYMLLSVPLALHYISRDRFGLWALVTQVSSYLALVDLGMSGSISRILIDHKDRMEDGLYGSVIKTGCLVLLAQGAAIILGGGLVSLWLPDLFAVPAPFRREFQTLVAGQCAITGVTFVGRMANNVLLAHQRFDITNYSQAFGLAVGLVVMWLTFLCGWGLYSLLAAYAGSVVVCTILGLAALVWLKLLPRAGAWGRAEMKTFRELFSYGKEVFLLTVGAQLVSASQVVVVSRTLGLDAAAVWTVATRPFALAQQVVYRLYDFSSVGLAEMLVRHERERLLIRFRDIIVLSASFAAWMGLSVALCNSSLLALWTNGRVSWSTSSDWLMGFVVVAYSMSRCFIGFVQVTKEIGGMKYVYLLEGAAFVALGLVAAPRFGLNGIILSALATDVTCSGLYGFWRTKQYFGIPNLRSLLAWLRWPLACLIWLSAIFAILQWLSRDLQTPLLLGVNASAALTAGFGVFWRFGLSPELRAEAKERFSKFWK